VARHNDRWWRRHGDPSAGPSRGCVRLLTSYREMLVLLCAGVCGCEVRIVCSAVERDFEEKGQRLVDFDWQLRKEQRAQPNTPNKAKETDNSMLQDQRSWFCAVLVRLGPNVQNLA